MNVDAASGAAPSDRVEHRKSTCVSVSRVSISKSFRFLTSTEETILALSSLSFNLSANFFAVPVQVANRISTRGPLMISSALATILVVVLAKEDGWCWLFGDADVALTPTGNSGVLLKLIPRLYLLSPGSKTSGNRKNEPMP